MASVSEDMMIGALKKVLQRENEDSWVLRPNFGVPAANDLRDFLNQAIKFRVLEINTVKPWLEQAIKALIDQRSIEKSFGLDAYEQFVINREAKKSMSNVPHLADRVFSYVFPVAN